MPSRKPCSECPFRRKALPGYTGNAAPQEFIEAAMSDVRMPCHKTMDYSDPRWYQKLLKRKMGLDCAGAAVLFANTCKVSRERVRLRLKADHKNVFSSASEFLQHHTSDAAKRFRNFLYKGEEES